MKFYGCAICIGISAVCVVENKFVLMQTIHVYFTNLLLPFLFYML